MKKIKLSKKDVANIVSESVKRILREAENGGWVVESNEATEAYQLAVRELGKETIDDAIIRLLSDDTLADCLAYIFRMYDFRQWDEYKEEKDGY